MRPSSSSTPLFLSSPSPTRCSSLSNHLNFLLPYFLHISTPPQINEMFSLKSFVLLALLASVSANRDLLQGEFFFDFVFSVFFGTGERCIADVLQVGHSTLSSPFFLVMTAPNGHPRWICIDVFFRLGGRGGVERLNQGGNYPVHILSFLLGHRRFVGCRVVSGQASQTMEDPGGIRTRYALFLASPSTTDGLIDRDPSIWRATGSNRDSTWLKQLKYRRMTMRERASPARPKEEKKGVATVSLLLARLACLSRLPLSLAPLSPLLFLLNLPLPPQTHLLYNQQTSPRTPPPRATMPLPRRPWKPTPPRPTPTPRSHS